MTEPIWTPSPARIGRANMTRFIESVNQRYGQTIRTYEQLHEWSIRALPDFWADIWRFLEIKHTAGYDEIVDDSSKMPGANWFIGAKLNYAQNLLWHRSRRTALISAGEARETRRISYEELYHQVAALAGSLREAGLKKGDRAVGMLPNIPEAVVAMLAVTSLGGIWSACPPDRDEKTVLDHFGRLTPKILFAADGYSFHGRSTDSLGLIHRIISDLPSIRQVILIPNLHPGPDPGRLPRTLTWPDFLAQDINPDIDFEPLLFGHPLCILPTSETARNPRYPVHSTGGALLQQLKELILHTDLKRDDILFYLAPCGTTMWHWQICALAAGATVILYDGSPLYPDPEILWRLAEQEKITIWGTRAPDLISLEKAGVKPGQTHDLGALRTILTMAPPISPRMTQYVYREIKRDVHFVALYGTDDIHGCYVLGNPLGPVYAGQIQCRGLGMRIEAYQESGRPVGGQSGELVCRTPFPSMPIYLWDDPNGGQYLDAYFRRLPGIWHQGDSIQITAQNGIVLHDRPLLGTGPGRKKTDPAE